MIGNLLNKCIVIFYFIDWLKPLLETPIIRNKNNSLKIGKK